MIAMALSCEPKLLIADEPTTALDVTIQAQILALLHDLKDRLGMAMLLITHDMGVIAGHADRVQVMYAGRMVEAAETADLFRHMRHPYTRALLASIPRLDSSSTQRLFSISGLPPDLAHPPAGCRFAPRCSQATDKCRSQEPPLAGETGAHLFACWHPVAGPAGAGTARGQDGWRAPGHRRPAPGGNGQAPPATPLLEVRDLVKEFPVTAGAILQRKVASVHAVSNVSFTVSAGETFGLVGESGCGKTTIGRVVVALERPDSGSVLLGGQDVSALSGGELRRQRRDLQLMFQDPYSSLDPRMRVGSIIREPLSIQHVGSRRDQEQRVFELLDEVGLPRNSVERYPHEFSGGQRQRIGLARALTLSPKVIVADEPVSALDVSIRAQVLNLMKRLQADHGLTYIVISHDLAVVKYMADRIGVMYLGRLVEMGSAEDIYQRAAHPYTAGLIATIPVPDPEAARARNGPGIKGELPSPIIPAVGLPVPDPVPVRAGPVRRGRAAVALIRPRACRRLPFPAAGPGLGVRYPCAPAAAPSMAATASAPSEERSYPPSWTRTAGPRAAIRRPAAKYPAPVTRSGLSGSVAAASRPSDTTMASAPQARTSPHRTSTAASQSPSPAPGASGRLRLLPSPAPAPRSPA